MIEHNHIVSVFLIFVCKYIFSRILALFKCCPKMENIYIFINNFIIIFNVLFE